jgi:hypothetical protein
MNGAVCRKRCCRDLESRLERGRTSDQGSGKSDVNAPLHQGKSGTAFRIAGLLETHGSLLSVWGERHQMGDMQRQFASLQDRCSVVTPGSGLAGCQRVMRPRSLRRRDEADWKRNHESRPSIEVGRSPYF